MKNKSAFDLSHVKGTSAICLLNKATGHHCGRIVANWSDNPNGSVCTATVTLYNNAPTAKNNEDFVTITGKAGGYGYDKFSQAVYMALRKVNLQRAIKVEAGGGNTQNAFEEAGFVYIQVC